jgi:CRP/FNR family transcriptional regulator, cyclic AMP receptor protein
MLRNISLFKNLSNESLQMVESHTQRKKLTKGVLLFHEGDPKNSLFIILSGEIRVFLTNHQGKEYTINALSSGDYFGELALIDGSRRSANIMASSDCLLMVLSSQSFNQCLQDNPHISVNLFKNLTVRIRELTEEVKTLALYDIRGRIERVLFDLAEQENGLYLIKKCPTQETIANRIGSSREMVSRVMRDLEKSSCIQRSGKKLLIKDKLKISMMDNLPPSSTK